MVATAQTPDYGSERGGPRAVGGSRAGNARPYRKRTPQQNKLLHDAITDVSKQLPWPEDTGEMHDVEWWKRRLTLQWLTETGEIPELIESLDGLHLALLLPHTSDLSVELCAAFIDWLAIFGAQHNVTFGKMR